ncbi:MAG TPA: ABC transporter permease [Acidobacteriaceae bacterium]|nr:ABC transporter permease [Acidobacteriaceae bacterium]
MFGFRQFFSRRRRYTDLSVSIQEHLEEKIEELMEEGMSREQAASTARRAFGNATLFEEHSREVWQLPLLEHIFADLRFAWRQAIKLPRFTFAAIATLAIGIAAQSTIYSVVHAVLIDPYPYRGAMRMVHLHLYDKDPVPDDLGLTGPQFAEFQKSPVLDGAIAEDMYSRALTGEDLPEQVQAFRISPNAFEYLGVPALLGREFGRSDNTHVAVLSYHFWKSHYDGRRDIVGRTLEMDHEVFTIVGVLPQRFAWTGADLYTPLAYSADPHRVANVFARLKPGVSDPAAEQAIEPLLDAFARQTPGNFPQKFKVHLVHINELAIGRFRGALIILFISVSFLLALACVNVAILLLARGEARQTEIALRKALGAGRLRVIGQLLTESLVLSRVGGGCGVMLALGGIWLVRHFILPTLFPAEAEIALNVPVLLFSIGVSVATGVISGLWPALRVSRIDARQAADAGSHKLAGRKGTRNGHMALLAGQAAITVLLLASSGATVQRLSRLMHADLGYDPHHLLSVSLAVREGAHHAWSDRIAYYEQIRTAIEADPDVLSAAIAEGNLPPTNVGSTSLSIPGMNTTGREVQFQRVSPEYLATLRIPLLHGRVWSAPEIAHAAHLALINQAMQRRYWPHGDPIGQTIVLNHGVAAGNVWTLVAPGNDQHFLIIGVVGDTPNQSLQEQVAPAVYVPYTGIIYDWFNLLLRTRGAATAGLLHRIKERVHAIDAGQAVGDIVTAEDLLEEDLGRDRFIASLFTAFAFLALTFAVSGLYCIQSFLVTQRTRELGVRIALGARREHIIGLVTRTSVLAVLMGTGIGLALDVALSKIFSHWTSGNSRDPEMLAVVVALLLIAAALASIVPARLAASIEPMEALRAE